MTKRNLSPAPLPPAKRPHTLDRTKHHRSQVLSFENSLYDELILCIFSHLSWIDLCVTQSTSKNWARLAGDNELWREQYLNVYGRTRLRGARGFIGRLDGREVKPLPGRAMADPNHYRDWKWMFRISSNWRNGRCLVENSSPNVSGHTNDPPKIYPEGTHEQTHIILAGALTIFASSEPTSHPAVIISSQSASRYVLPYYDNSSQRMSTCITALALDQSPPTTGHLSLACFLSTGEFSVFEFNPSSLSHAISRKCIYQPARRTARTMNIVQAAYYHPLLVTVSSIFSLSIYDLSSGSVRHTQTLSTFTSYPPVSLVLSSPSTGIFKLVITYSVPVYPRHWSIGATELMISSNSESAASNSSSSSAVFSSPSFREDYKYPLTLTMSVITSRTIRAFDVPSSWVNDSTLRAMREQWGRKLLNVADAQTDGKWVVLAPGTSVYPIYGHQRLTSSLTPSSIDSSSSSSSSALHSPTSLQLYRLVLPVQSNSIAASPPKLNFVRTLHGQTSPVSSLALADGRCVSLGQNGSIWVWDLEGGTGAEVASADEAAAQPMLPLTKGTVSFDDRRIVTAHRGKLVVRRFDI
ncbi:hypothetical protein CVT25_013504 [Psilocybe cyanescens]|uniref:F-box domain-containing protein n=1 Tax=Psilocybe cyanescens TaxID=93625 RepID=A0A409XSL3_PSICY|nr:hypothetical protein CVT25_013504 [Psilocybe cyanescens]